MADYTISGVNAPVLFDVDFMQGVEGLIFQSESHIAGTFNIILSVGTLKSESRITAEGLVTAYSFGAFRSEGAFAGSGELINTTGSIELYSFILTGANDGLENIEIPITSIQMRQYNAGLSYLSVVIPGIDYADEISSRSNGTLEIYLVYAEPLDLTEIFRFRIIETAFDSVVADDGVVNKSISLSGNETTAMKNARLAEAKTVTLTDAWLNYSRTTNGLIRLRLSAPHRSIRAGDTVICDAGTFVVDQISWTESVGSRTIEISEAA